MFYCDVYHVSICAQHAENPLKCVHDDRRFRKRRRENGKLFLPFPLHHILWNIHEIHVPRFTMECAAIPKTEKNVKSSLRVYFICQSCCSVEGEHILSSHRSTRIQTVRECRAARKFYTRAVYTARPTIRIKRERKTLGEKKERKTFSNSQRFFEITFCAFSFSLHSLFSRLRAFHRLGTTKRYLLLKSSSFILSHLPTPPFFSSCKNSHVHDVNQLRVGAGRFLCNE